MIRESKIRKNSYEYKRVTQELEAGLGIFFVAWDRRCKPELVYQVGKELQIEDIEERWLDKEDRKFYFNLMKDDFGLDMSKYLLEE